MSATTRDAAITIGLVIAFALLVSVHAANVFGVFKRRGALLGLGAFLVPPLAPFLAARAGMTTRAGVWVVAAAAYLALVLAAFGDRVAT
jgi:hypothetical protein